MNQSSRKFLSTEAEFDGAYSKQVFETIFESFKSYKRFLIFLFFVGFIGRILLLSSANIIGKWVDSQFEKPDLVSKSLTLFANVYFQTLCFVVVLGFILNTYFRIMISRTGARAVSLLYDEVTYRTSRLPISFFDTNPVGRIISRFSSDYGAIFRMAGGPLGEFLCLVFDLFAISILMLTLSIWYLPVLLLLVCFNYFVHRQSNQHLRQFRRNLSWSRSPAFAHFAETVQGVVPIRAYGKIPSFSRKFNEYYGDVVKSKFKLSVSMFTYSFQMAIVTAVVLGFTILFSIFLVRNQIVSIGSVGAVVTFILLASNTIQQFFEWLANLEEALTGVERMNDYLRKPIEPGNRMPVAAKFFVNGLNQSNNAGSMLDRPVDINSYELVVRDLSLRYRQDMPLALDHLTFEVRVNDHFAIVGKTGCGKSSLLQALFFLYAFDTGGIELGGKKVYLGSSLADSSGTSGTLSLFQYRSMLSFIPQDPVLFRGPLRFNITMNSSQSDDMIWFALEQVGLANWVRSLESSSTACLKYNIEERGSNLSTGQRQLICMARAIVQDRPIIVMDEATSSVDPESELKIMRALELVLQNKTRIVVAHRPSTIVSANVVMTLDRGRMVNFERKW